MIELQDKISFYNVPFSELSARVGRANASLLFNWHYKKNLREFCSHHNLSRSAKGILSEAFDFSAPRVEVARESRDRTVKFLFRFQDETRAEAVLIPFQNKYTVCVSSQVGCAMNCSFCHTARQGFTRHLSCAEIVGQVIEAKRWLTQNRPGDDRVLNIVFMGQGEPLHNFRAVARAINILTSQHGVSLAPYKITVSTAGYLPGLKLWRNEGIPANLALSLHSPIEEKRSQLIPLNRRYPLREIMQEVDKIPLDEKRFITYEYLLIGGFNDHIDDAHATCEFLKGRKAFLNLIPFNSFPGTQYAGPSHAQVLAFKQIVDTYQIPTTIRKPRGDEILAACGQLHADHKLLP